MIYLWCGETGCGRCKVTCLPNFLGWVDLLTHGAPLLKRFCFMLGKIGFSLWLPVASARGELEMYRPANVVEWHAVEPQPAYKTFEDILVVLLGSIVA